MTRQSRNKKGDRQRTPRSPFGLKPQRPRPEKKPEIVGMVEMLRDASQATRASRKLAPSQRLELLIVGSLSGLTVLLLLLVTAMLVSTL
jgi:hypothetical protein